MGFLSDVITDKRPGAGDNVSQVRGRARRRLIGAAVLLAVGVIGFPLLFETKPRPVSTEVPAVLASKERVAPASTPSKIVDASAVAPSIASPASAAMPNATSASAPRAPEAVREIAIPSVPAAAVAAPAAAAAKDKAERDAAARDKAERDRAAKQRADQEAAQKTKADRERREQARQDEARRAKTEEDKRARSALEGRPSASAATASTAADVARYAVQVGAYTSEAGVSEVRTKLDRVGLKSYTQVVRTSAGVTTRVRAGPYASRRDAEQAAEKARSIGLQPALVPLPK